MCRALRMRRLDEAGGLRYGEFSRRERRGVFHGAVFIVTASNKKIGRNLRKYGFFNDKKR